MFYGTKINDIIKMIFTLFLDRRLSFRPHNFPLKILCLCNFPCIQLLLNRSPILQKIIQNRIIKPHRHRGAWRPVIVVIIVQRKVWVGIIPRCAALGGHQLDNAGLLLVQPEKLLQNIIRIVLSVLVYIYYLILSSFCV